MTTRVGIVGTGSLGRVHARILTEMPEATVIGFVDPRDEAAGEVTSQLNLRRFDSVSALKGEIDNAMALMGVNNLSELNRDFIRRVGHDWPRN